MEIMKNDIPEIISVRSIRTVYSFDFRGQEFLHTGDVHDFPEIIYIRSGRNTIRVGDSRVALCEGQMTIYPPGAYHIGESASDLSVYIISFDSDSDELEKLYSRAITLSHAQKDTLTALVHSGLSLFERIPKGEGIRGMRKKSNASEHELQKLKKNLELFLIDLIYSVESPSASPSSSLYADICRYLEDNLRRSVSLDEVARVFHIGKSTLTALFRSKCGMGMTAYFNKLKIEEAQRLIQKGDMNLSEISDDLGFSSIHYFSRLFKATVGVSPSKYSKKCL